MIIADSQQVEKLLDVKGCISLMKETLTLMHLGKIKQYIRHVEPLPNGNVMGFMTAYFEDGYFGSKVLSVYPKNSLEGYPSHQGEILLYSNHHGVLEAMVDATSVTKIRTGCVSALATDTLANKDASVLCLLGCGHQAESHLEAILEVREIKEVFVWDLYKERAEAFKKLYPSINITICESVQEAVKNADIICTLTPSNKPILKYEWVKKGCHINAVGACSNTARELDSALMKNAKVYGDHFESILKESGDFVIPLNEGVIEKEHYCGDIAEVILNKKQGRTSNQEITIFDALGLACEDIASANYIRGKLNNE